MNRIYCTLYIVHCTVNTLHCTVYTVQCIVYNVSCILNKEYCTVYNVCLQYQNLIYINMRIYWICLVIIKTTYTLGFRRLGYYTPCSNVNTNVQYKAEGGNNKPVQDSLSFVWGVAHEFHGNTMYNYDVQCTLYNVHCHTLYTIINVNNIKMLHNTGELGERMGVSMFDHDNCLWY